MHLNWLGYLKWIGWLARWLGWLGWAGEAGWDGLVLLGHRTVINNYAGVTVKSHQQMLETFLKWADGLQTKKYSVGPEPSIYMATNLKDNMDEAVPSRAKVIVDLGLPDSAQCTQWWKRHAPRSVPLSSRQRSKHSQAHIAVIET